MAARRQARGRVLGFTRRWRWPLIGGAALSAFCLGFWGFSLFFDRAGGQPSLLDRAYLSLALFTFDSGPAYLTAPWPLQIGRFLAVGVSLAVGLGALSAVFRDELSRAKARLVGADVVVFGLGTSGSLLARAYARQGRRVVGVDADPDRVSELRSLGGITVITGDAADPAVVATSGVDLASIVVVVCGDQSRNADIAIRVRDHLDAADTGRRRRSGRVARCYVHVDDGELFNLLDAASPSHGDSAHSVLRFFNPAALAAPAMVDKWRELIDQAGAAAPPHLVVVGLGQLGRLVLLQAIRSWWYQDGERLEAHRRSLANHTEAPTAGLPRVTVFDPQPAENEASLLEMEPLLKEYCQLTIVEIDAGQPRLLAQLANSTTNWPPSAILVTLDDDLHSLTAGLALRDAMSASSGTPVIVRLQRREGLAAVLDEPKTGVPLVAFSLAEWSCQPDMLGQVGSPRVEAPIEAMARLSHFDYLRGPQPSPDASVPWDELPEALRESNRAQARDTRRKLAAMGCVLQPLDGFDGTPAVFTDAEIARLARLEHERWCEFQRAHGWVPTDRPEDPKVQRGRTKQHPYLRGWDELDEGTQEKDLRPMRSMPSLLLRGGCFAERRDHALARLIHTEYSRRRREEGGSDIDSQPVGWAGLDESLRQSCLDQAQHFDRLLQSVGCQIVPDVAPSDDALVTFTGDEVELMAEQEHRRWCHQREQDGWAHADEYDLASRRTPDLVPWVALSDAVRELDREAVRAIPCLVAATLAFRVERPP